MTKGNLGRVGFTSLCRLQSVIWGGQGSSLEAGTWKWELKQRPWRHATYWLAPHGPLSLFSYTTRNHLHRGGTAHCGLGPLYQSLIRKMPHRVPVSRLVGGIFSVEVPSSQMTLAVLG